MSFKGAPMLGIGLAALLAAAAPAGAQLPVPVGSTVVDPEAVPMPALAFTPDGEAEKNYDKYFFFNRSETDFASAYADLQECDGYSRGFAHHVTGGPVPYPYAGTIGGAVGGAVGSALADAIFGSAERRKMRRINMRRCMTFKDYKVYGLPKGLWEEFNFEEGLRTVEEDKRDRLIRMQAKAASGPAPKVGELVE